MIVRETKRHDYSLQFNSHHEADLYLRELRQSDVSAVQQLSLKLADRLTDRYAHDNISYSTLVFSDEARILIFSYLLSTQTVQQSRQDAKQTQPWSSWWETFKKTWLKKR